jgi:hypothetical protein
VESTIPSSLLFRSSARMNGMVDNTRIERTYRSRNDAAFLVVVDVVVVLD